MTDEYIASVSDRYIELYEHIIGQPFVKADTSNIHDRINRNVLAYLESIKTNAIVFSRKIFFFPLSG
ncbi:hypothetical protein Q2T40_05400 [Winogradskyella maritima]|nr:hypothetical protein [Winogradskyella maritima]